MKYTVMGIVFGLTAGISPGPLLTLVISETLVHNRKEGIKVAITPLLTDIPIVILTSLVLSRLDHFDIALGIISILGGIFIIYLGIESFKAEGIETDAGKTRPESIRKGIIVNLLSPHPYLFWLTVGVPLLFKTYTIGLNSALGFVLSFYVCLVGSKVIVAILVNKSRNYLKNKAFKWIMRLLGLALVVFAVIFIIEGCKLFGMA